MSIATLCRAVPCARSTFYAHFGNLRDVLDSIEDEILAAVSLPATVGIMQEDGTLRWDMLERKGHIVRAHRETLCILFVERPDGELVRRWTDEVRKANRGYFAHRVEPRDLELVLGAFAAGVLCFWREWISDPDSMDTARIARVVQGLGTLVHSQDATHSLML